MFGIAGEMDIWEPEHGNAPSSLLTGLAAYYAFSSGNFLADSTANGNTLSNVNSVTQAAGLIGQAANFVAASSQNLQAADSPSLDFTSKLSISHWFNPTGSIAAPVTTLCKGRYGTNVEWLINESSTTVTFYIGSGTGAIDGAATVALNVGAWNHIAIIYDGTQVGDAGRLRIWVNGVQQTLSFTGTIPASNTPVAELMVLGALTLTSSTSEYINGLIDECGLWNVALTPTQIAALYNAGAGITYPFTGVP